MGVKLLKASFHCRAEIKKLMYRLYYGRRVRLEKGVTFRKGFSLYIEGGMVSIGRGCFFNNYCSVNSLDSVTIGEGCIFGEGVRIYDHDHRFGASDRSIKEQGFNTAPIKIGRGCWIGSGVVILKGVTVGDGCIVAAGCTIDRDVPDNTVVRRGRELIFERRS